ncbi:GNAT family N-acetyltransferase [Paenibacillus alkalitolerans]|uniref:GNAT family N-acetyltransferase n=1 Tax=Paenibacillus alkalitolerans TaxID=2799335 RepID=UPI0018F64F95|nr:GNAT family N-acetyltransferase [Paenibacillus alkalitolerans]
MNAEREQIRFDFVPMTEAHAQAICAWRYEPPYDRYNWEPWEELVRLGKELADPHIRAEQYRSAMIADELCGFAQWFPLAEDGRAGTIRLGLGLRPDLCGQGRGIGAAFAKAAASYALRLFPGWAVDLEVAADNRRAVAAYERAGFTIADTYELPTSRGPVLTYCMVWNES